MSESQQEHFERQLLSLAGELEYPRTPDVAGAAMRRLSKGAGVRGEGRSHFLPRRLAWLLAVLLVFCASLMLIPPARAAILEFIQIGAVRIFRETPTSTSLPLSATPGPTQSLIPLLEKIAGEMTLSQAQQIVNYPILLPSYPRDLGQPDRVFVQEADGKMTILVWMDPHQPDQVRMSLHIIPSGSWAIKKMGPQMIQETSVKGQHAIWAIGPYMLQLSNGDLEVTRLVAGHVLIWTEGDLTYRLETNLGLDEAIKVAESLQPIR